MQLDAITLDHGAGGRATHQLITTLFSRLMGAHGAAQMDDATVLPRPEGRIAVSTDTFVVSPLFFPGGDIGRLAVHGTINDLAMRGARPLWLACGFVLEEGLELEVLERVVGSMAEAAAAAGVEVVAGDTKVVARGQADKIFINTCGVGVVPEGVRVGATRARAGDIVIVSGSVGDHGAAILSTREGLGLEAQVASDTANLYPLVRVAMEAAGEELRLMRDPTRGGLATTLNEIAAASKVGIELEEDAIPVRDAVRGVCEILGMDPLYLACEGRMICVVGPGRAREVVEALAGCELGRDAAVIGQVRAEHPGRVWLRTSVGGRRLLDMLTGEPLPRIC